MISISKVVLAGAAAAVCTASASAQSFNPVLDPHQGETRIVGAITIPLGQSTDQRRTAPRVELISRSRTPDGILPVIARDEERRWQERRIGFTLDGSDQMMINGRPLTAPDERVGLNTLETVGVVVGVIAVGSMVILATNTDDLLPPTS